MTDVRIVASTAMAEPSLAISIGQLMFAVGKMNCALMKQTELKMLWKLVKAGEDRPLTATDLALLLRILIALELIDT